MKQAELILNTKLNNSLTIKTYKLGRGKYETFVFFCNEVLKCIETSGINSARSKHQYLVFYEYGKHIA